MIRILVVIIIPKLREIKLFAKGHIGGRTGTKTQEALHSMKTSECYTTKAKYCSILLNTNCRTMW